MKTCSVCKESLPSEAFGKNASEKDGLLRQCKACNSSRVKTYFRDKRAGTPEYKESLRVRNINRHGLTVAQFEKMLQDQNGLCLICDEYMSPPAIDHDHTCCPKAHGCSKCVRGLLCQTCNKGLGHFEDSVERLEKAKQYLSTRSLL